MTVVHTGAIAGAVLSGTYALVALAVGTPFAFGVALALCGTCWIAADYLGRPAKRERTDHRRAVPVPRSGVGLAA
ncbi:MAG: hypothetical protein ACRDTV_12505 [Mycobacterium sp.]